MGEAAAELLFKNVEMAAHEGDGAEKSQTMPSRTTSAQSRHTATGWPSPSTTIDTTSQVPKSTPSHSGEPLFAGVWLHRAAAFCSLE